MASILDKKRFVSTAQPRQLPLFPEIVCSAYLVATDSPQTAFYRIWIEADAGIFTVIRESGVKEGRVPDKRCWPFDSLEAAQQLFDQRIRTKTNPQRKSLRKYTLVYYNI